MKPQVEHEVVWTSQQEAREARRLAESLIPLLQLALAEGRVLSAVQAAGCTESEARVVFIDGPGKDQN